MERGTAGLMKTVISGVKGRRVWDSRGRPTVEAEVKLANGVTGRAIAPAGASRGSGEAVDLRDAGGAFGGYDVTRAVAGVNTEIATSLIGVDARDQSAVDRILIDLDGTTSKSRLGGNALVATSLAVAHAMAAAENVPLCRYLGATERSCLPLPEIQIFGGGAHAGRRVDIQDFMIIPIGAANFTQALEWAAEIYRAAGEFMSELGRMHGVADEGGYWPAFDGNEEAIKTLVRVIERAGLVPGEEVAISLDVAASEFAVRGRYRLACDSVELDSDGLCELLLGWTERYPIVAVEDPLGEHDEEGLIRFTQAVGNRVEVIGDDFLVTDAVRVAAAAASRACNAVLLKPNQAGTLSETRAALDAANAADWGAVMSARSGESEDVSIVHLAVGWGVRQLKVGSIARGERTAKWNEALRIADELENGGQLPPAAAFPWGRES